MKEQLFHLSVIPPYSSTNMTILNAVVCIQAVLMWWL